MAGKVVFSAFTDDNGRELWVTDGTDGGTSLLLDIYPGPVPSNPIDLTPLGNGEVVFAAKDGAYGPDLWVTDGTPGGTQSIANIGGLTNPHIQYITPLGNGTAVFQAGDGTHGVELWSTNGVTASRIDIYPGSGSSDPRYFAALGNGEALFKATTPTYGTQLWVTDGTSANLVSNINLSFNPDDITSLGNGQGVFIANDGTHGNELWVSNGNSAGTSLVLDVRPGPASGLPFLKMAALGDGRALFQANDGVHGYQLWATNGTASGTFMITNMNTLETGGHPREIPAIGGGGAMFIADDGSGDALFVTDGSAGSYTLLARPGDGFGSTIVSLGNGDVLFSANDGTHGSELWVSDGTPGGTSMLDDINPGALGSLPAYITPVGNGLALFQANDGTHGLELWITNGTSLGTHMVQDILPGDAGSLPDQFAEISALCFCAGTQIATSRGDVLVEQLAPGDLVRTASGTLAPIVWIGRGRVLATRGCRGPATPVVVRRGALADNVPNRDLHVTKGHSLSIDGVLVPVEFLVNHRSIVWDDQAQEVAVYHVELARHDVLIANGAPAESYRDDGNRWLFSNANPGWDEAPQPPCAPVLTGGDLVDCIWRRLLDRALPRLPVPTTGDPDLHLLADGARIDGLRLPGGVRMFWLPRVPREVCIMSRAGVPQELGTARDPRLLGVALRRVAVWQGALVRVLEADDPALSRGFHEFEPDGGLRWTDGAGQAPAELFAGLSGRCGIELRVAHTSRYPVEVGAIPAAA